MLLSRAAIEDVIKVIGPEDFYQLSLGKVFSAIQYLYENGSVIDVVTVTDEMRSRSADFEGVEIVTLMTNVPSASSAGHYAKIVSEHKVARDLIRICSDTEERAYQKEDPYELTGELESSIS